MSTFENNYLVYFAAKDRTMPAWAKAERHEYCEPAHTRKINIKKRSALRRTVLSVLAGVK